MDKSYNICFFLQCQPGYDERPSEIESFLHEYYKTKRKKGEWFDLSANDILAITHLFWEIEGEYIEDNIDECFSKNDWKEVWDPFFHIYNNK